MSITRTRLSALKPSFSMALLAAFLILLWLAGGSSRADALGQALVRAAAWLALAVALIFVPRPVMGSARPIFVLMLAVVALPLLQLVPLPPDWWQALPGRGLFAQPVLVSGAAQPWRPWSVSPAATRNALFSLIVPFVVLVLASQVDARERRWLPAMLLGLMVASMLLGLLQFSGVELNNPFINDGRGAVSANFANRNHLALFLAMGCLIAPVWAFMVPQRLDRRGPMAIGLVLIFVLTILATGSRAGILLGPLAIGIALLIVRRDMRHALARTPRWVLPALLTAAIGAVAILVLASIAADRAVSINRALTMDAGEDLRVRALPTLLSMIALYFPAGSGFGAFDPVFRIHEPFDLLSPAYFNHAHNDFLEIVLDAGLPGLLLLMVGLCWWLFTSIRLWRLPSGTDVILGRLGSAMLLLVFAASPVDYPARTPMIMAVIAVAALLMTGPGRPDLRSALP